DGQDRHVLLQHVGDLDVAVAGQGADGHVVTGVADVRQVGDAADVHEDAGLGQPQLHERQQAVAAGEELGFVPVLGDEGNRFGGPGADVVELGRDHEGPPERARLMASQTLWGEAGMAMSRTPMSERASTMALMTAGAAPMVPASPMPFTPSGLVGDGVTVWSV